MSTTLSQLLQEADLPLAMSEDLDPLMTALRSLTTDTPPEPSPQLAALLAHPVASRDYRFRRSALAAVAAVIGSFTLTGVAAAVEILPDPAQQFVADLSESWPLPFQFSPPVTMEGDADTQRKSPDDEAPAAPATTDEPAQEDPAPDGSDKPEPPKEPTSEPTKVPPEEPSPQVSPSAPATPSDPPPSPSAPTPSDAPSPSLGAEEPAASPSAGDGSTSPSPSSAPTEPDHARENETGTPTPSPSPPLPSGSTGPSGG